MTPFDEAAQTVLAHTWTLPAERVPLESALDRVLAADITSDLDMPPFDKAMVDGFACCRADLPGTLKQVGEIPAGAATPTAISVGECARIMTGAPVPTAADCVVMIEHSTETADGIRLDRIPAGPNIVPRAEDIHVGQTVLTAGRRILPQDCAVLAAVGATQPKVARRPRVGILATGSELVPPDQHPGPGQIRNSNAYQMAALVTRAGGTPTPYGIAADDEATQAAALQHALDENDIVLTTGGVSVGDYDFMPRLIEQAGLAIHLRKIAMQPGKPMIFATRDTRACFGLSGNPVSCYVQFVLFVRPFLHALQGLTTTHNTLTLPIGEPFTRKPGDRLLWRPARIHNGHYHTTQYHGSGHLNALTHAHALIPIPAHTTEIPPGTTIQGTLLDA
jgi:molybdopterin molybdotransferase